MSQDLKELSQRKLNFFQTLKAIAWAMFGVRKGSGYQEDMSKLNPVHLVIAGLLFGVIFVVGLVMIVRAVISSFG
ncbi:DUF2970 domain-containing protein [Orrella sp. NBD-18]|uniref:DUF2970 domain-containing protein n=1 Tax=Sheuella amnicola TaxID=2707330 RepID=A0A6B2QWA1_9BURK|nr:DUF2970 domain-containing protein [Sheuella amnicola]NDY82342.1 DUF2970 domain-containing protein [Sheuella amnicola]HBI82178.1 hypothetical protein [Alcaligenaceae bacterium]